MKTAVKDTDLFLVRLMLTAAILAFHTPGETAIRPGEIVAVVNGASPESLALGKRYLSLRNIPETHLAKIMVSLGESISRDDYDRLIAAPLAKRLLELGARGKQIRCLVTLYGVPLRINPVRPDHVTEDQIAGAGRALEEKKAELERLEEGSAGGPGGADKRKALKREIQRLRRHRDQLSGRDTVAAVDSELALLLWPPYRLEGMQPNPAFAGNGGDRRDRPPVLMVARIDGPTVDVAERLVTMALEVEREGLTGTVYLDARGLTGKSAYSAFDDQIRKTAKILKAGLLPVVLDNRPELFGPGEAPSAALYCGWYSLGEYRDVFAWQKGAVGYHVASAEARSLRNGKKGYWTREMIKRGVAATLGPVAEPYLSAFPAPSLFFPLLMSGRYQLMEVFAMTNPFLSWQIILIGDPLYNPFRAKPAYLLLDAPPPPD